MWRGSKKKILRFYEIFGKIAKCGVVRIKGKFTQINVHFAFCWFVGIREKYFRSFGRIPAPSVEGIRKFHEKFSPERNKPAPESWIVSEDTTQRSFLEQDSTTVPNFANRSILSCGNLVGVATPSPPFCGLRRLKNPRKNIFGFFKKHFRLCPCFSPIGERAKHKKKGGLRP